MAKAQILLNQLNQFSVIRTQPSFAAEAETIKRAVFVFAEMKLVQSEPEAKTERI